MQFLLLNLRFTHIRELNLVCTSFIGPSLYRSGECTFFVEDLQPMRTTRMEPELRGRKFDYHVLIICFGWVVIEESRSSNTNRHTNRKSWSKF